MTIRLKQLSITTDASGDYDSNDTYTNGISIGGVIRKMHLSHTATTGFSDTVDVDVTDKHTAEDIWSQDNLTAKKTVRPSMQMHKTTGADEDAAGSVKKPGEPVSEIRVVIAQGGATKTDTLYIWYEV